MLTGSDSIGSSPICAAMASISRLPVITPPPRKVVSTRRQTSRCVRVQTHRSRSARRPAAQAAPTSAPTEAPVITSGRRPRSASARRMPMCAQPRAEPLLSARPRRGRVSRSGHGRVTGAAPGTGRAGSRPCGSRRRSGRRRIPRSGAGCPPRRGGETAAAHP